jgi:iron(III) transport system ATP-binding protein
VLVTHDQQEALSLADQVVVMREGRVEQAGPPDEIYAHPASRWVAEFLGAAEVLPATLEGTTARCELGVFPFDGERTGDVEVVVRPEYLVLGPAEGDDGEDANEARVVGHALYGHDQVVRLELASGRRVHSRVAGNQAWAADSRVRVWVAGPVTVLSGSSSA